MSTGKQLKYIRTTQGFTVFPCLSAKHDEIARVTPWPLLSAGFVEWDFDGLPLCWGRSESLNLNSMACDTAALRAEWGLRSQVAPVTLTPVVPDEPACKKCGGGGYGYIDVFEGALCHFDARCPDCNPAPLNPAALADARKFGEVLSDDSLEQAA